MKLNKFLVTLVVIVVCIGCVAFVGCKKKSEPSGDNYPVVQDTSKVNVYIANEVVTTQEEFGQKGTFAKYSCEYDSIKDADEGLFTFFDNQDPRVLYTHNGSILTECGSLVLSDAEEQAGYRIVAFTTVVKDQDTTDIAKRINLGSYHLVSSSRQPYEMSFEEGCLIIIAKVKY